MIVGRKEETVHLTMITTYGVAYGKHSGIVHLLVEFA